MFSRQIDNNYSSRITKGITGLPHRKRLHDISNCCSKFKDLYTLDIGCNDLYFDQRIIPNQKVFVGCDLGWENSLHKARENVNKYCWTNVHLIKSVGEHIPLTKNYFDLVLCCETLEHVENETSVINEIKRVSKDNSILIVSAPIEFGPILFF
jgi:ubiquinone/menaquinone biosynthesis C-methylase UbiE